MNCAEIKKLFSPYLDGRVSGAEMRAVTRHVVVLTLAITRRLGGSVDSTV